MSKFLKSHGTTQQVSLFFENLLKSYVLSLEMKIQYFDELHSAMRIAQVNAKRGLNDDGHDNMDQIETTLKAFIDSPELQSLAKIDKSFSGMLKQIQKRWHQLFTDPIVIERDKE
jgi:hypothetical protein